MASAFKFEQFPEDLAHAIFDFSADSLLVILSNTALSASLDAVLVDITQISTGNGYTTDGETTAITGDAQSSGTYKMTATDVVWTAGPSAMAQFQYVVLYDTTPASTPTDPLILGWDYGSAVDLANLETFTWDQDQSSAGVLQIS